MNRVGLTHFRECDRTAHSLTGAVLSESRSLGTPHS